MSEHRERTRRRAVAARVALVLAPDLRRVLDEVEAAIQALVDNEHQDALDAMHRARQLLRGR